VWSAITCTSKSTCFLKPGSVKLGIRMGRVRAQEGAHRAHPFARGGGDGWRVADGVRRRLGIYEREIRRSLLILRHGGIVPQPSVRLGERKQHQGTHPSSGGHGRHRGQCFQVRCAAVTRYARCASGFRGALSGDCRNYWLFTLPRATADGLTWGDMHSTWLRLAYTGAWRQAVHAEGIYSPRNRRTIGS
jgi:hypothetical protein